MHTNFSDRQSGTSSLEQSVDGLQTAGLVIQTVAEDVFIWAMGRKRSVYPLPPTINLHFRDTLACSLVYLLTYLLMTCRLLYKDLHGCAPSYLGSFTYVADLPSRRGLRSSCSDCLVQPPVHRSTVGSRAGSQMWNCLPPEVTSGTVSDSLLHSTQDVPLHWVWTFGLSDMFVFTHRLYVG